MGDLFSVCTYVYTHFRNVLPYCHVYNYAHAHNVYRLWHGAKCACVFLVYFMWQLLHIALIAHLFSTAMYIRVLDCIRFSIVDIP